MTEPPATATPEENGAQPAAAAPEARAAEPAAAVPEVPSPVRWWRIAALVALVVGLLVLGKVTGLTAYLTTERIRTTVEAAGWWGALLYIAAFCLGELVQMPGMVFVAAAVIAYGRVLGGALALLGAVCSVSFSFFVARSVGGKQLHAIKWRFAQRILGHLDAHPVRTITILRLIFWMGPQLNYILALSNVRFRDYLLGSALGLFLPIVGFVLLFDKIFN